VESLDVVAHMLKERLGAASVSFLITDFTGGSVVRLGAAGSVETDEPARRIPLPGTLYDDVIRTQRPSVEDKGGGTLVRIVAPVTNRGTRSGSSNCSCPRRPTPGRCGRSAIPRTPWRTSSSPTGRTPTCSQWGRRTTPLSLAAEIQHRLLPASLACEAAQFAVAGVLEPADHVGGDTFDYVIDRDTVQLSVTDAMDHRLVMLTDGMQERNAKRLDLAELIVRTRALHPREAARTLIAAIVDANDGHLQDDATVMCLDWHGVGQSRRDADTGADLTDASERRRAERY
jgi:hypothetical protein